MNGAAAWRGTAGALGCGCCGVDFVGSARQAFAGASAFNQNIGSWNTASMTTMSTVRALVSSPECGAQPTSLLAAVVPAASGPGADVGMAHLGCARVAVHMWTCSSGGVGQAWLNYERVLCNLSMHGGLLQ
jgi:surface protein